MEPFEEKYKAEGLPHTTEAMLDLWHYLRENGRELLAGWQMLLEDYADIMSRQYFCPHRWVLRWRGILLFPRKS